MEVQTAVCVNCLKVENVARQLCAECLSQLPCLHDLTRQLLLPDFILLNVYKASVSHPWSFHYAGLDGWTDRQSYVLVAADFARDADLCKKMLSTGLTWTAPPDSEVTPIFDLSDCITFVKWMKAEGLSLIASAGHGSNAG
ncbi:MAG: hypothetical protein L0154_03370 [Chloroflexi bacterium]|nr:hypothetical protein [Chloroflexota bacterium]